MLNSFNSVQFAHDLHSSSKLALLSLNRKFQHLSAVNNSSIIIYWLAMRFWNKFRMTFGSNLYITNLQIVKYSYLKLLFLTREYPLQHFGYWLGTTVPNRTIKNVHFYSSHIIFHTNVFSSLPLLPASAVNIKYSYGNKKDVGETSIAYPTIQAFALPMHKDKQLSQPTPLGIIYNVWMQVLRLASIRV